MRTEQQIANREADAMHDAADMDASYGLTDEYGDLTEAGWRYVNDAVTAYIGGEE